jgi:amino acid permease
VTAATGHRIRWILVWLLVAAWFVALALNIAGNLVHLLLLGAIAILVYELLVEDTPA